MTRIEFWQTMTPKRGMTTKTKMSQKVDNPKDNDILRFTKDLEDQEVPCWPGNYWFPSWFRFRFLKI